MPKVCSVPQCGATTKNTQDRSFHQFPKDASLRTAWIKRIGRKNFQPRNSSSVCSCHFGEEHFRQPNNNTPAQFRKATLKRGSLPTYNLLEFPESFVPICDKCDNMCEARHERDRRLNSRRKVTKATSARKTKKRKLNDEFSKESPAKNENLHDNAASIPMQTEELSVLVSVPVVVAQDENIAPERSPSPDVSKSRRKAPRSQLRKVVRTDSPSNVQKEKNISPVKIKSETASPQESNCHESQGQHLVQDVNNTTTCRVLTSPRNKNLSSQTVVSVAEHGRSTVAEASETTVTEEDYQRKYFHLLNTMNDLQDKFLISQRNFEDLVQAREAFIDELKGKLESNHREIGSIKQELETSNKEISELEEKRRMYEDKIQNLSEKVEDMKFQEAETKVKHHVLNDSEEQMQRTIEKQQEVLEFYKLLTSVTVEKVTKDGNEDSSTVYDKFRCSMKTAQTQELQFLLSYDSEFAEVEYTPLALDTVDSTFPGYLKEQIFFESAQAPNFLRRLIQSFQKPDEK